MSSLLSTIEKLFYSSLPATFTALCAVLSATEAIGAVSVGEDTCTCIPASRSCLAFFAALAAFSFSSASIAASWSWLAKSNAGQHK